MILLRVGNLAPRDPHTARGDWFFVTTQLIKRLAKRMLPASVVDSIKRWREPGLPRPSTVSTSTTSTDPILTPQIDSLETALWLGDESEAVDQLTAIAADTRLDGAGQSAARLVLARWQAVRGEFIHALNLLERGTDWVPFERETASLFADCLCRMGQMQAALAWLAPLVHRREPDASTLLRLGCIKNQIHQPEAHGSGPFIEALNRIFAREGFAQLRRDDVSGPADLTNVTGLAPPYEPREAAPLVSVIVPVARPSESLSSAVQSVAAQTWPNLEIIVVGEVGNRRAGDDLSPLLTDDSRVRAIEASTSGDGLESLGWREATGEFVMVHGVDEWSHPQRIEVMATAFRSNSTLVAAGTHAVELGRDLLPRWADVRSAASLLAPNPLSILVRRQSVGPAGERDQVPAPSNERMEHVVRQFGSGSVGWLEPTLPLSIVVGDAADPLLPLASRAALDGVGRAIGASYSEEGLGR